MEVNLFAMGGGLVALLIGRKLCLLAGKPEFPYPWHWMSFWERVLQLLRIGFGYIIGYAGIVGGMVFLFQLGVLFVKILP